MIGMNPIYVSKDFVKRKNLCISYAHCENGRVAKFCVKKRCSTPLESPCSTSTCVESLSVFSSSPLCPTTSVECSRDIFKLGHWSVQDKELLNQKIDTSPSFGGVQSIMEVGVS